MKKELFLILALIVVAISTRLLPHWPNFTAVGAAALFSGAYFKRSGLAFIVPIAVLFISDLILNNLVYGAYTEGFQWFTTGFHFMYFATILAVLIGSVGKIGRGKIGNLIGAGFGASITFYLITNFGAWLANPMYSQDFAGLISSYMAGLPFLINGSLSTLLYGMSFFGLYWYATKNEVVESKL